MSKPNSIVASVQIQIATLAIGFACPIQTLAQITPDSTLGRERSEVTRNVRIRNVDSDRIDGGARRGSNLFHSFEQFNIPEEQGAYFTNPAGIRNIFTRVTGGNRSEILGQLGVIEAGSDRVLGKANLFFMNPNGIIFGRGARLDIGGSFIGTTANEIQFDAQNDFSASNPTIPAQLLTVNPTALWFNQIATQPGSITSRGFLSVPEGQSLFLVGSDIRLNNSMLQAAGGQVAIVATSNPDTVGLTDSNGVLRLNRLPLLVGSDITIENSVVDISGSIGGNLQINAENLSIANSDLISGASQSDALTEIGSIQLSGNQQVEIHNSNVGNFLLSGLASGSSIEIRAGSLTIDRGSILEATSLGAGRTGNINLFSSGQTLIDGENTRVRAAASGAAEGGNIRVKADSLQITNAARLITSTFGQGDAGNISATVRGNLLIAGAGSNRSGGGLYSTIERGTGDGGKIDVQAGSLLVQGGAGLVTRNNDATGDAGNIELEIRNVSRFENTSSDRKPIPSGVFSNVTDDGIGNGGDINIATGSLFVLNGAQLNATTSGRGNAGRLIIVARDRVVFDGVHSNRTGSGAFTAINAAGVGEAGNFRILADSLSVTNGAQLSSNSQGRGNAGNIIIQTRDRVSLVAGTLFSNLGADAVGAGGNIRINTGTLTISDGAQLRTDTLGRGRAGDVVIQAQDTVLLNGSDQQFSSGIFATTSGAAGQGGRVEITAPVLRLVGNALINSSTANDRRAGNIDVHVDEVELFQGGQLVTATSGGGQSGTIEIQADQVTLSGRNSNLRNPRRASTLLIQDNARSGLFASTTPNSGGNGGNITVHTNQLRMTEGARISARSRGSGAAGRIAIDVDETTRIRDSDITTSAQTSGGSIDISSDTIQLRGNSDIRTAVANDVGNGGDINLTASSIVAYDDSDILAFAGEQGGDITFDSPAVFFEGGQQAASVSTLKPSELNQNNQVNVNAAGAVAGVITLPNVSFIENSLNDLPENAIDSDRLLATSCIARSKSGGTFLITGSGGLPNQPSSFTSAYPTGQVRSIPVEAEPQNQSWQPGDAIVEPQGIYRLPNGRLVMSRVCQSIHQ